MEKPMGKRKMSRVDFKVDATIKINETTTKCKVKDLSLSGIYLLTDIDLNLGEKPAIHLKITSGSTSGQLSLVGEVIRKDTFGIAFEFLKLPLDSYLFLRNIVVYNSGDAEAVDQEYRRHLAARKLKNK